MSMTMNFTTLSRKMRAPKFTFKPEIFYELAYETDTNALVDEISVLINSFNEKLTVTSKKPSKIHFVTEIF
jgi:hypothetical protein